MSDDISDIASYYDGSLESEHNRLERHQLEYDLTSRYFERYLPPSGRILEVGAATGRYTLGLARRGYDVTAVDLSETLLAANRAAVEAAGLGSRVRHIQDDARDLSKVSGRGYDAALLMGPLYHLVYETDRRLALRQVYERLRPGGILFSAFISRLGVLGDLMSKMPEWIEDPEAPALISLGRRPDDAPREGFRGYFARADEIAPLHASAGFQIIVLAGVEPAISADDESYNRLDDRRRQLWQQMLFDVSAEPSTVGASRHLLYIGRK